MKRLVANVDTWLCLGLAAATVLYLAHWPHDFMQSDEGTFLYDAKRVLDGDVIYRDFFEVIMPTSIYAMAALFSLFGTSIDTARTAMAVIHATIVVTLYHLCRALGVRRTLSLAVALAHVAIAYPPLTITTPHWVGTLITLLIIDRAVAAPRLLARRSCLVLGALTGLLITVQHQRGVITGLGVALLLAGASVAARSSVRQAMKDLGLFAGPILLIVGPVLLTTTVVAGFTPVFDALVRHPLVYYTAYNRGRWGQYHTGWTQSLYYVFPELIRWLPAVLPLAILVAAWRAWRSPKTVATAQLAALTVISTAALAAIAYFPDLVHLALVAPLFFVLIAALTEVLLGTAQQVLPPVGLLGHAIGLLLCARLLAQAHRNPDARRYYHPHPHDTVFGRIDYRGPIEFAMVEAIRKAAAESGRDELFCYTSCAGLYLTTGTKNPTPYQLMIPGYNRPDQLAHCVELLESRQVELVAVIPVAIKDRTVDDPIRTYLKAAYQPVRGLSSFSHVLMRRRSDPVDRAPSPGSGRR